MPEQYVAMRDKFKEEGLGDQEAKAKAAAIYNSKHKDHPVTNKPDYAANPLEVLKQKIAKELSNKTISKNFEEDHTLISDDPFAGQFPSKSSGSSGSNDSDGHWVTIGAHGGHGGSHVFIDKAGVIDKGASHLVGEKPNNIPSSENKPKEPQIAQPANISEHPQKQNISSTPPQSQSGNITQSQSSEKSNAKTTSTPPQKDSSTGRYTTSSDWIKSLSEKDAEVIELWKSGPCKELRKIDRTGGGKDQALVAARNRLYELLDEAPEYKSDQSIFRGASQALGKLEVGSEMEIDALSSFSKDQKLATSFSGMYDGMQPPENYSPTVYEIKKPSKHAVDLSQAEIDLDLGKYKEQEVVVKKGAKYRIASVQKRMMRQYGSDTYNHVVIEEI